MDQASAVYDFDDDSNGRPSDKENEVLRVESVYAFLEKECAKGPLSFYDCVLDPDSYSRTVENIYYISVLVNQGRVNVYIHDTYQIPFIRTVDPKCVEAIQERFTSIVSIDMDRWKKLIDTFDIKEAKMTID